MATKDEVFLYLDDITATGEASLLDAHRCLMRAFDMPPQRAEFIVRDWMRTYNARHGGAHEKAKRLTT